MKLIIEIYTERGSFKGRQMEVPEDEAEYLKEIILRATTEGTYFKLETDDGYIVLSKELLQSAAFVVKEDV